jgi:hypothetical protein
VDPFLSAWLQIQKEGERAEAGIAGRSTRELLGLLLLIVGVCLICLTSM